MNTTVTWVVTASPGVFAPYGGVGDIKEVSTVVIQPVVNIYNGNVVVQCAQAKETTV